jgi:hypothetical protein
MDFEDFRNADGSIDMGERTDDDELLIIAERLAKHGVFLKEHAKAFQGSIDPAVFETYLMAAGMFGCVSLALYGALHRMGIK